MNREIKILLAFIAIFLGAYFLPLSNPKIKEAILNVKISQKSKMRINWDKSKNPILQLGLYKLIGTKKERDSLTQTKSDITSKRKKIKNPKLEIVVASNKSKELLNDIINDNE